MSPPKHADCDPLGALTGTELSTLGKPWATVNGTPGNDLASFMDGPHIVVHGNAQDGGGNTMNGGEVIVHGRAGDVTGHAMPGHPQPTLYQGRTPVPAPIRAAVRLLAHRARSRDLEGS